MPENITKGDETDFGLLLRRHRAAADLTQEELAEQAGISARTISDIERGLRRLVYRDTAARIADALGLRGEERGRFETAARGRSGRVRTGHLPMPVNGGMNPITPMFGRDHELAQIASALRGGQARLLTLTGPGGIGKTRLAIAAMDDLALHFPGGAFFVPLAATRDPGLIASTIARGMGLIAREPVAETVKAHLRPRRALLVLDTFEHILDVAPLIGDLLGSCPGLTVIVTSRAPLRLRGEHEFAVPPLEVPPEEYGGDLGRYPTTELFVAQALAVRPELDVDDAMGYFVAEICRGLDGLPLAIELAAARVKHLPLTALRDQLGERLRLLTGGPRDLPRRQRTMRDTIEWSYDLLTPAERGLFRALSVFAGGWTLEAASTVWAGEQDTLIALSSLIDQSMVFLTGSAGEGGRYDMLDVIREYAAERRNAEDEGDSLRDRHANYFLALAEGAEAQLSGSQHQASYRRLEAELGNLRAAFQWALERSETELALRLAGSMWMFWRMYGGFTEGRRWLLQALALDPNGDHPARSKALWGAGWLAYHQGDYSDTAVIAAELLELASRQARPLAHRNALTLQGMVAVAEGRYSQSVAPFEEALAICREFGPSWHLATSAFNLGQAVLLTGDTERAESLIREGLSRYEKLGDRSFCARSIQALGYAALRNGNEEKADGLFRRSLGEFRDLDEKWGIAEGLEGMSATSAARRQDDRAAVLAGAAEKLRETTATRQHPFDRALSEHHLRDARPRMGEETWRTAWARGKSMTLDEAMRCAINSAAA